jgi:hypothetical protein
MDKRRINLRVIHDGVQPGTPLPETLHFGLQDAKGEVHAGAKQLDGTQHFDLTLEVKGTADAPPVLTGAFAHGPPTARFLYLSWKREGQHAAPYGWRIKIPLSAIGWNDVRAAEAGQCLAANVLGRRPHKVEPVTWWVVPLPQVSCTCHNRL